MSSLQDQVRTALQSFIQSHEGYELPSDILRIFRQEANLQLETEAVRDMITADPFETFEEIKPKAWERLKQSLRVTACERIWTGADYARIHAQVSIPCKTIVTSSNKKTTTTKTTSSSSKSNDILQLTFLYERKPREGGSIEGCHVTYSIELSRNHGERERLLHVQVWAPDIVPSSEPAICIQDAFENAADGDDDNDGEEDGWEDIDDDDDDEDGVDDDNDHGNVEEVDEGPLDGATVSTEDSPSMMDIRLKKKQKTANGNNDTKNIMASGADVEPSTTNENNNNEDEQDKMETRDQYVAFLDPDVLLSLYESLGLLPIEDAPAFFLLMTFPFYEQEWDLVGFVMEQYFGGDGDSDDEGGNQDAEEQSQ